MLSIFRVLKESVALGSDDISARTVTNADLNYSETFAPGGMDAIGIVLDPGATATGTTPTIAAALQVSYDGGTTFVPVAHKGGVTAISTGALSASGPLAIQSEVPVVETGTGVNALYRWAFTYANADNDFVSVSAYLTGRKFAQRVP